ncbi:MAG: SRPBCC family protein, partial [Pseudomonadota bacterium]
KAIGLGVNENQVCLDALDIGDWDVFQIYPGGVVNTYYWRPLSQKNTQVHRGWFSRDGVVDDTLQSVIDLDRDTTFAEDLMLVKQVQRGLGSRGYRPGPLVISPACGINSEHAIAALHEWVREDLSD